MSANPQAEFQLISTKGQHYTDNEHYRVDIQIRCQGDDPVGQSPNTECLGMIRTH